MNQVGMIPALAMFVLGVIGGCSAAEIARQLPDLPQGQFVTGIGGVFIKSEDPGAALGWYRKHLGLPLEEEVSSMNFFWREPGNPSSLGFTVWSMFPDDSDYFGSPEQRCMINFRVRDMDSLLAKLKEQGVQQVKGIEEYDYGRFAWVVDADGNRIELWEPVRLGEAEWMQDQVR